MAVGPGPFCLLFHFNFPPYPVHGWVFGGGWIASSNRQFNLLTKVFPLPLHRGGNGDGETGSCLPKIAQLVENSLLISSSPDSQLRHPSQSPHSSSCLPTSPLAQATFNPASSGIHRAKPHPTSCTPTIAVGMVWARRGEPSRALWVLPRALQSRKQMADSFHSCQTLNPGPTGCHT